MQVKQGFKLKEVCGERILVPMGENNVDFSKLIALNESSYLLWKRMEKVHSPQMISSTYSARNTKCHPTWP